MDLNGRKVRVVEMHGLSETSVVKMDREEKIGEMKMGKFKTGHVI
jgi:hypothetical protein